MLRSTLAVVAGFLAMAALVMAGTMALAAVLVPGGLAAMRTMRDRDAGAMPTPTPGYLALNLLLSLAAAVVGGWVTARVAGAMPAGPLAALAVVVLAMGVWSAASTRPGAQPSWYRFLIPILGVVGVVIVAQFARGA